MDDGTNPPITINSENETITTLVSNGDGSYTYINESGEETVISINGAANISFTDNGDGTFTLDDGTNPPITINSENETITTLVSNGDGSYTYINESGEETVISINGAANISFTDNGDGTFTLDDGTNPPITINRANETNTTLVNNNDGTYSYTNEAGVVSPISIVPLGSQHFGSPGSVFFANSTTGEPTQDNSQLYWDNDNKRLGIGTNNPSNTLEVNGIIITNRVSSSDGSIAYPGYHFKNSADSGMWSPSPGNVAISAAGSQVVIVTDNQRVGIDEPNPQATLHVGGDLIVDGSITTGAGTTLKSKTSTSAKNIRRVSSSEVLISDLDDTLILEPFSVNNLIFPVASFKNKGRIIIIKSLGGITNFNVAYSSNINSKISSIENASILWLQSDGVEWQQIN